MKYCDNCGEECETYEMFHYANSPFDVSSAKAGESASVCERCNSHLNVEDIPDMTLNELLNYLLPVLPNCTVGEDNSGQIIIYTDLMEYGNGQLTTFKEYQ